MSALDDKIMEYLAQGLHCSQIVYKLSQDLRGQEDEQTIRALGALGGGMFCRRTCGTLTGGVCLLSSYFPREEGQPEPTGYRQPAHQLVSWFEAEYGSIDCRDLVEDNKEAMLKKCPKLMAATFEKCLEILQENGIDPYE